MPNKDYIISNFLSKLVYINNLDHTFSYLKLDVLFVYYTMLVKIYLNMMFCILEDYTADN